MIKLLKLLSLAAGIAGALAGPAHAREEVRQPSRQTGSAVASDTSKQASSATGVTGTTASDAVTTTAIGKTELIDINSATEKELASLPKIGESKATAIVKNRPYRAKNELVDKKILTKNEYNEIKDQIIAKQKPGARKGNKEEK